MKKYIRNILLFFIAIVVIDQLFGAVCQYLNDNSKGGGIKSRYYVCKESNEEVLIFGSSRAKHHYVPDIIEDSLSMTCYNTGEDGNGIIMCYGFLKMITRRYIPKVIIYDISGYDIYQDDNMKYLDLIKPYYYEPGIDSIFWKVAPKTRLMMLSNLYRYNTTCLRVLGNYLLPMDSYPKGYSALYKTMEYEPEMKKNAIKAVDDLKLYYFEKFIKLVKEKGIHLICCVSPIYRAPKLGEKYEKIEKLCKHYDVPYLYCGAEESIFEQKKFFKDRTHMNDKGARYYTSKLMSVIKTSKMIY